MSAREDLAEIIASNVENGRWACIPDPGLREFVRLHVVYACADIADVAMLRETARLADEALGGKKPPTELKEVVL